MRMVCEVVGEESGEYTGQRGLVKFVQLSLSDKDPVRESRMINTFDIRLSTQEDKDKYAGKLLDKLVVVDVRDVEIYNARLRVKTGRIIGLANGAAHPVGEAQVAKK
jgi:hypothetical protein